LPGHYGQQGLSAVCVRVWAISIYFLSRDKLWTVLWTVRYINLIHKHCLYCAGCALSMTAQPAVYVRGVADKQHHKTDNQQRCLVIGL